MVPDGVGVVAALATLGLAAGVALVADRPPARPWRWWRFPLLVAALAAVNIGLSVVVAAKPTPMTGTAQLGCAVLLVYAAHRRARAVQLRSPPRRRPR